MFFGIVFIILFVVAMGAIVVSAFAEHDDPNVEKRRYEIGFFIVVGFLLFLFWALTCAPQG